MKHFLFCFLVLISSVCLGQGQDDHINWSFNKYSFAIDDKWKIDITPIIRLNQNFTNYQNSSLDYMVKRPIGHGLTLKALGRTWFIPNQKFRQFIWLDIEQKLPNFGIPFNLSHRLRFHGALDINDRMDRDFMRYIFSINANFKNSIVQPFFALEPWWRLNGENYFERLRTEVGFSVKANKNLKWIVFLRNEDIYDLEETYTNFIWMSGMQYTFDQPIIKPKVIN